MGERLFNSVSIRYTMQDHINPKISLNRVIEDVADINQAIHQTAKSARLVGMEIHTFIVEVTYEN